MAETKPIDPNFQLFLEVHHLYPGRKRYVTTEFKNFKKQHKDWKDVLPLIAPSLKKQIAWKEHQVATGQFSPEWKQFSNWIDGSFFEEDTPEVPAKSKTTPYF